MSQTAFVYNLTNWEITRVEYERISNSGRLIVGHKIFDKFKMTYEEARLEVVKALTKEIELREARLKPLHIILNQLT